MGKMRKKGHERKKVRRGREEEELTVTGPAVSDDGGNFSGEGIDVGLLHGFRREADGEDELLNLMNCTAI